MLRIFRYPSYFRPQKLVEESNTVRHGKYAQNKPENSALAVSGIRSIVESIVGASLRLREDSAKQRLRIIIKAHHAIKSSIEGNDY